MFPELNPFAIGTSAVFSFLLGALWYSPRMLGTRWMRALGISRTDISEARFPMLLALGASLATAVLMSAIVQGMVVAIGAQSVPAGLLAGFLLWFGCNFSTTFKYVFWEDRPWTLLWIDSGYDLVSFATAGILGAVWR